MCTTAGNTRQEKEYRGKYRKICYSSDTKKTPKKERRFKNLAEMNNHILTKRYGKIFAKRVAERIKKQRKIHQPAENKLPI